MQAGVGLAEEELAGAGAVDQFAGINFPRGVDLPENAAWCKALEGWEPSGT